MTCSMCGGELWREGMTYCSIACSNKAKGPTLRARANEDGPRPVAWACGAGIDSTAIAVLIYRRELPPPDYAWIVDVGYEPRTTWDYVREILTPKLAEVGVDLRVIKTTDYTQNDLVRDGFPTIPAYRRQENGDIQKLFTHCSNAWKARVAERWLRAQGVKAVEQWIGIAADEERRAKGNGDGRAWVRLRYPLIERGLTRADCTYLIGQSGWPLPERTSCWLCPQRSNGDWRRLAARNPEDFARAVAAERDIQRSDPSVFLHRSGKPLAVAVNGCVQAGEQGAPAACAPGLFSCA